MMNQQNFRVVNDENGDGKIYFVVDVGHCADDGATIDLLPKFFREAVRGWKWALGPLPPLIQEVYSIP